jgi:hypothetical protein
MSTRKKKRMVEVISKEGSTKHDWIDPWNQKDIWKRFADKGIILPDYESFERKKDLRILEADFYFKFKNYNKKGECEAWNFHFKPGFIWDLASVPVAMRGIVQNDSRTIRAAAMVHDVLFYQHLASFRESNKIFYRIIRAHSGRGLRAFLAFFGVSTAVGRKGYNSYDADTHWSKDFVEVT